MATIEFESCAYIYTDWQCLEDVKKGKIRPLVGPEPSAADGFVIGTAKVTVELHSEDEMTRRQLGALQKELTRERAESQARQNAILERISKLQALTMESAA